MVRKIVHCSLSGECNIFVFIGNSIFYAVSRSEDRVHKVSDRKLLQSIKYDVLNESCNKTIKISNKHGQVIANFAVY